MTSFSSAGANAYRRTHVESRTPLELIVMLYDAILERIAEARRAMEHGDIAARRQAVDRALAIVSELQSRLNMDAGGDIAASLDSLYAYVTARLIDASASSNAAALEPAASVLSTLRDAWRDISVQQPRPTP